VSYNPPYEYDFAPDDDEAKNRAAFFREHDPFPNIPAALLSSEHVSDYVRVTGLLHPFDPSPDRLKAASYEARAQRFIRWEEDGRKIITDVRAGETYELPENSIVFVQIESKIRLPDYIALRFNLRIKHVHRGLLLGTGPLVDPGFGGDLLIPLHNLTSKKYVIKIDEGIIWIEFTKTSHNSDKWPAARGSFSPIQSHKTDVPYWTYFERANQNNPIQSSIPSAVKDARELARSADTSAKKAVRTNRLYASIGILALAGLMIGLANITVSIVRDSAQAASEARRALGENEALKRELALSDRKIIELESRVNGLSDRFNPMPAPQDGTQSPSLPRKMQ
jgi:deoxycytidine triphosphate deaminase